MKTLRDRPAGGLFRGLLVGGSKAAVGEPAVGPNSAETASAVAILRPRVTTRLTLRAVLLVVGFACALTFFLNAFWRESYTGDEGFYGVTALNMLHSPSYWLRPSYYPLGNFVADQDGFAHPPFNSYFYAVALWIGRGSLVGPEVVNLLALAALLYVSYRLLARVDVVGARIVVLLLAASPPIRGYYSMLEAEPLLTTFGLLSLWCCLQGGFQRGRRRWLFAGGLCLGMAFALKLWLCGPMALAVAAALLYRAAEYRTELRIISPAGVAADQIDHPDFLANARPRRGAPRGLWTALAAGVGVFALGFVLPSGAHLGLIACLYPQDLGFWLKNIYFGIFMHAGISGSKFAGNAIAANWIHPVWYYGAALYRDDFFVLPAIVFGAVSVWRESARKRRLVVVLACGIAGLAPLSVIKVKEPLYVLTCAVLLYLLAALCLASVVRRVGSGKPLDRFSILAGTAVTAVMLLLIPAAYVRGIQGDKITLTFVVVHSLVCLAFLGAVLWSVRTRTSSVLESTVFLGCATAVAVSIGWSAVTQRPRDAEIVRLVKPYLAANAPTELSMIASNFKCYQYYAFAKGCYWHDLDLSESPQAILSEPFYRHARVFILDPQDQQKPENAAWLRWLEANTVEKTPELDRDLGTVSGYRVFVRDRVAG